MTQRSTSKPQEQVIIKITKRRTKKHDVSHGSWKVAYADFVTALMAFFLLLWLVAETTPEERAVISELFNPYEAEDDSRKVEVTAGIISIMDGGQMGGEDTQEREITDPTGVDTPSRIEAPEDNPIASWDTVEMSREEYEELMRQAEGLQQPQSSKDSWSFYDDVLPPESADTAISDLSRKLERMQQEDPILKKYRDIINVEEVPGGLLIQIIDQEKFSMFSNGSAELTPRALDLIGAYASVIKDIPFQVAISGHTDSKPFLRKNYSNWNLSADRALAAMQALVRAGVPEGKIAGVEGRADQEPIVQDNPSDPRNRRIQFMILR